MRLLLLDQLKKGDNIYRVRLTKGKTVVKVTLKNDEFKRQEVISFNSLEEVGKFLNGEVSSDCSG